MASETPGSFNHPFEGLSEYLKGKGVALPPVPDDLNLPTPPVTELMTSASAEEVEKLHAKKRAWIREGTENMGKNGELIGNMLTVLSKMNSRNPYDREIYLEEMKKVRSSEEASVSFIKAVEKGKVRDDFIAAYLTALRDSLPLRTPLGLNHFADQCLASGAAHEASPETPEKECVKLPVSNPDGSWEGKRIIPSIPGVKGALSLLQQCVEEVNTERAREAEEAEKRMGVAATGLFTEVMRSGNGKAIVEVPDKERDGRRYSGGKLLIHVEKEKIYFLDAGGSRSFVNIVERIREADIFIPLTSVVNRNHPDLTRVDDPERRKLIFTAWDLVHRAWKQTLAAPKEDHKKKA